MEDRIPYKGRHILLSRHQDRWIADIIAMTPACQRLLIHGATLAAAVNAAFAVIDAQERAAVAASVEPAPEAGDET